MTNLALTPKRMATYLYIAAYIEQHSYSPTVQETADHFGLTSLASANKRISALVQAGVAVREGTRARNIRLLFEPRPEGLRLDEALRAAGPDGWVARPSSISGWIEHCGPHVKFTREDVLAVGWEVVK